MKLNKPGVTDMPNIGSQRPNQVNTIKLNTYTHWLGFSQCPCSQPLAHLAANKKEEGKFKYKLIEM